MTNAGKTFTIAGSDENPGLLPRALEEVFNGVAALCSSSSSSSGSSLGDGAASSGANAGAGGVAVLVSYLEIFNENCYDLLDSAHMPGIGAAGGGGSLASVSAAAAAAHAAARVPLPLKDGR
jgi:hypothetical protein